MRTIPFDVVLSWPSPNYTNPTTRGPALVIINSILIALVVVVVGLRLYTRLIIKRWFGVDDVFIILALIFTIGLTAIVLLANQSYGWNRHVYDIELSKLAPTAKVAMAAKVVFTAAATFTRLSLLFFYYRLVSDSGKRFFVWMIHANVAYSIGIFISFTFLSIFQCNPLSNYWVYGVAERTCLDEGTVTLVAGIINCVADFFCTVTPIPMVMRLQMPKRQRLAVAVLFGLGFIVTVAGIVRTWYIYKSLVAEYDQTWYAYPLWIAAAVEIDLGVICASAPVLRPLLLRIPINLSNLSGRFSKKTGYTSNSSGLNPSHASRTLTSKTAVDSDYRPETIDDAKLDRPDRNFELRQWEDVERGARTGNSSRGSEDAILGSDDGQPDSPQRRQGGNGFTVSKIPPTLGEHASPTSTSNWRLEEIQPLPRPISRPSPSAHVQGRNHDWPLRTN